ncbi:MAG: HAD family hydrolase [Allosphingosinicella sp.]
MKTNRRPSREPGLKLSVRAAELPTLLDRVPQGVRYLSLDCFDTLLWRNTVTPRDVFADLPIAGGGLWPRAKAEARARARAYFDRRKAEVHIEEIYRSMMPHADDAAIATAVEAELAAEARLCYAFAPTVELMRAAKARGLEIIVVSDTYYSEAQLRDLIARSAGDDVAALIDRIFVSSAHGIGKSQGLFKPVLRALKAAPEALFHVGDNPTADQAAPAECAIASAHLVQFNPECAQRLRLEASAAAMIDNRVRNFAPAYAPHRAVLSLHGGETPTEALGHDVLGPVMHAFVSWVEAERREMADRLGRPVKLLFLMRDGHLPMQVHHALFGDAGCAAVELSRFTSRRASFTCAEDVRRYLAGEDRHGRTDVLTNQLGLTAAEGTRLSRGQLGFEAQDRFSQAALAPQMLQTILSRSRAFADRVIAHLSRAGVGEGDAVMFVDLGYSGTVQNLIEPVLRDRLGLAVAGRYLLLRDIERWSFDKKGLIDDRHYDLTAIHALCAPMAAIEQLSTIAQGSVIDYAADGAPIRKDAGPRGPQDAFRDRIQQACVEFARHAGTGVVRPARSDDADCRRTMVLGVLARFLFLPTSGEVEVLQTFDHDVNLGSEDVVKLVDSELAGEGLRRRGLFYVNQTERLYLPGELQQHGLSQQLAMFATTRHQFDLRPTDFHAGMIEFPGFVADATSQMTLPVEAYATHDGYYQATVPVGESRFAVGLQLGTVAEWLQIEEAAFHAVDGLHNLIGAALTPPIDAEILCEGMEEQAPGFYRCREDGLLLVPPPPPTGKPMLLSLVFRPVVRRAPRLSLQQAA